MWATSATHMLTRLTSSTLFYNHNLASMLLNNHRTQSTTTPTSDNNTNLVTKMRDLRPRSPYALFLKDNYKQISAKNPNMKLGEISKQIAAEWKGLSDEQKQSYTKKAQDQKTTYEEEKKRLSSDDLQVVHANEKAKRLQNRIKKSLQQLPSKRPRAAFQIYLTTLERGEASLGEFMKGATQHWSQMSVQDKQKFEDLHQQEKQNYSKALLAWAATNTPQTPTKPRRSASSSATQTKTPKTKKTRARSATRKRTVQKRTSASTKPAVTTKKSAKKTTAKEASSSSSSSDDDDSSKTKKSSKSTDAKS